MTVLSNLSCLSIPKFTLICFISGVPSAKKQLKPTAVPSQFAWTRASSSTQIQRRHRYQKRATQSTENRVIENVTAECEDMMEVSHEVDVEDEEENESSEESDQAQRQSAKRHCQTQTPFSGDSSFNIFYLSNNPSKIKVLTGLNDMKHFMLVFSLLGDIPNGVCGSSRLAPENQLFLTLIKLRHAVTDAFLSVMFDVSRVTVGSIFNLWIQYMYEKFGEIDIWPDDKTVPEGQAKVIIDCTECPIQTPLNPSEQQATYSTYKKGTTMKFLVGISHTASVTFCSEAYGGATTDKEIFERCGIIDRLKPGDIIVADRGFLIDQLLPAGVHLVTPAFLKGKFQLCSVALRRSRAITKTRIHVERIIGLTKNFTILEKKLHRSRVSYASQIFYVCAFMCNLRPPIV